MLLRRMYSLASVYCVGTEVRRADSWHSSTVRAGKSDQFNESRQSRNRLVVNQFLWLLETSGFGASVQFLRDGFVVRCGERKLDPLLLCHCGNCNVLAEVPRTPAAASGPAVDNVQSHVFRLPFGETTLSAMCSGPVKVSPHFAPRLAARASAPSACLHNLCRLLLLIRWGYFMNSRVIEGLGLLGRKARMELVKADLQNEFDKPDKNKVLPIDLLLSHVLFRGGRTSNSCARNSMLATADFLLSPGLLPEN